jgi:hypothetical protein
MSEYRWWPVAIFNHVTNDGRVLITDEMYPWPQPYTISY